MADERLLRGLEDISRWLAENPPVVSSPPSLTVACDEAIAWMRGEVTGARAHAVDVAALRAASGASIQALAAHLGVSERQVVAWETGAEVPRGPAWPLLRLLMAME